MNNELINLLIQADSALDKMSVSGENVFFLSYARKQLKTVFDNLVQQSAETGVSDNG